MRSLRRRGRGVEDPSAGAPARAASVPDFARRVLAVAAEGAARLAVASVAARPDAACEELRARLDACAEDVLDDPFGDPVEALLDLVEVVVGFAADVPALALTFAAAAVRGCELAEVR